jgi:two-component system response regulator AtoC
MNRELQQLELEELRIRVRRLETELAEAPAPTPLNLRELVEQAVREAMRLAKGNKVHAAKSLGISRRSLYRLIRRYRLEASSTG